MSPAMDLSALSAAYQNAQSVVCFVHPQATYDAVAAATALQLAFTQAGKSCAVVCEAPMRVEYNRLVGIDQITPELGNRDLVISFDYSEEKVDKVSYNVNEATRRFELIISPKKSNQPLDPSTVEFSQSGLAADIIFLFGFHAFDELGHYYEKEKYAIDAAFSIALTQNHVPAFAKYHVALQPDQLSYSEWAFFAIRQLQLAPVKDDLASNILQGVEYATDRFANDMTARTFDTVSQLMKAGGRRMADNPAFQNLGTPIREAPAPAMPPGFPSAGGRGMAMPSGNWQVPAGMPSAMPANMGGGMNLQPMPQPMSQPMPMGAQDSIMDGEVLPASPVAPATQAAGSSGDLAQAMSRRS